VLPVEGKWIGPGRLDDQGRHQAEIHLVVLLEMRVIPARARRARLELVDKGLTWLHGLLGDARHPIHRIGHVDPMPVDGGGLGERVVQDDADALALLDADLWPRHPAVVGHGLDRLARR
jgi:hypothetical protein